MFIAIVLALGYFGCEDVRAAAIGDIARNVHSDLVLLEAGFEAEPRKARNFDFKVPAGGAVDLFYRYGFFSLSVRVVPRDDPGRWLIREPTTNIFDDSTLVQVQTVGADSFAQQPIQISLCEDLDELMEAYFRDFTADGIEQPHKLFTGSWRLPTAAKYLGLNPESLDGSENSYVLVKMVRDKATKSVSGNLKLNSGASRDANDISVGDTDAIMDFVKNYGTHFIQSVSVGDAIYQVFALDKDQMRSLLQNFGGRKNVGLPEWAMLYERYLAPWLVKETGEIRAASGDVQLQRFLADQVRVQGQFGSYPNLVEGLVRNPRNVQMLEDLTTESASAVVGLHFASLRDFFPNLQVREFYDETFSTQSALWGANI